MERVHLECFVTLAEELHYGRASARLHIGPSAMSKRISELERRLGVRLFDRSSREVRMTPAGRALVGQAQRALEELSALRRMASDAAAGAIGDIRAAYSPGNGEMMTVLTREVRTRAPHVVVHPEQMISLRVATAVRARTATVGIVRIPPDAGLATMVLAESPVNLVALPADHRLSSHELIEPEALAEETVIGPSRSIGGPGQPALPARFREADVTTEGELFDLVSAGFGLLITTEGTVRRNPRHDIVVRPLGGAHGWSRDLLVWRLDDDSPIRRAICEIAEEIRPELATVAG